jgi:6-pyruvoyltetrahydropterin/6-carboxytetrahydropterin synthase
MYTISKLFTFDAAHRLEGLPAEHKCSRLHGHTYTVKIELSSLKLDKVGFVKDYNELNEVKKIIDENFDHRCLNEVLPPNLNPTAENLAKYIFNLFQLRFPQMTAVEVSETPKTNARYVPNHDETII